MLITNRTVSGALAAVLGAGLGSLAVASGSVPWSRPSVSLPAHRPGGHVPAARKPVVPASIPRTASIRERTIPLKAMPVGQASFSIESDHELVVGLEVAGLTPDSGHRAVIAGGSCGATVGNATRPLRAQIIHADSRGDVDRVIAAPRYANTASEAPVHLTILEGVPRKGRGGTAGQLAAERLACATVTNPGVGSRAPERLVPISRSGTPVQGYVRLRYNRDEPPSANRHLAITVNAHGFVPRTTHAARLYSGSCGTEGSAVDMLPDLTADARGQISAALTMPVTSWPTRRSWHLTIHQSRARMILRDGRPALPFRPLLCADLG